MEFVTDNIIKINFDEHYTFNEIQSVKLLQMEFVGKNWHRKILEFHSNKQIKNILLQCKNKNNHNLIIILEINSKSQTSGSLVYDNYKTIAETLENETVENQELQNETITIENNEMENKMVEMVIRKKT